MNFNKKFDYEDPKNFMMDNITMGTIDYYKNKFSDKLPLEVCEELELKTRVEYDQDDIEEFNNRLMEYKKERHNQILKEFLEREEEGKEPELNISKINISNNNNDE